MCWRLRLTHRLRVEVMVDRVSPSSDHPGPSSLGFAAWLAKNSGGEKLIESQIHRSLALFYC